jgi:hypothetical protein
MVYGFHASGLQRNMGSKTMPRTLPALGAVAVIAFSIGFNTVQFPVVWDMVGPTGESAEQSNADRQAADAQPDPASQPAQPAEPVPSAPSANAALTLPAYEPVALPASPENAMPAAQAFQPPDGFADPARQTAKLVPIPSNLFTGRDGRAPEQSQVERLPPVYESVAIPAGRYAAEYPQEPIPIYPSTGM